MEVSRLELNAIRHYRERLDFREEKHLRSKGWKQTSSTPGCYWMWEREWATETGVVKTFLVSHNTAVRIQSIWDSEQDAIDHPGSYED